MQVGVYFDLRNPRRWRRDPAELYGSFLELCEEVEQVGLDSIWVTEHHGFDDDYLPSPLTLAGRGRRPHEAGTAGHRHRRRAAAPAAEIAEQAAVVDLLSGGRLDLGIGAGYRPPEFDLYGADMGNRYRDNDARARQVRELWASGEVTPAPAQERLPIWMGYLGPRGRGVPAGSANTCWLPTRGCGRITARVSRRAGTTRSSGEWAAACRRGPATTPSGTGRWSPSISPSS